MGFCPQVQTAYVGKMLERFIDFIHGGQLPVETPDCDDREFQILGLVDSYYQYTTFRERLLGILILIHFVLVQETQKSIKEIRGQCFSFLVADILMAIVSLKLFQQLGEGHRFCVLFSSLRNNVKGSIARRV